MKFEAFQEFEGKFISQILQKYSKGFVETIGTHVNKASVVPIFR